METPGTGADDDPQPRRLTGAHRAGRPASVRWRGPFAALAILAVATAAFLIVQFGHGDGSAAASAASASPYPRNGSTGSDGAHGASPTATGGHARASAIAKPRSSRPTPAHA